MAPVSGVFEPFLDLGGTVHAGEPVGQIHDVEEPFQTPRHGDRRNRRYGYGTTRAAADAPRRLCDGVSTALCFAVIPTAAPVDRGILDNECPTPTR